jgi:hypothetical protein
MTRKDPTITSAQVIELLVTEIPDIGASDLLEKCKKMGMRQVPYQDFGFDSTLPSIDAGYHLRFNPDGKEEALFEILQKDGFVLQAGFQITLRKAGDCVRRLAPILAFHYGEGYRTNVGNAELINYGDEKTIAYLSHSKLSGSDVITIRVGNKRFGD